jgi:hypothetical protein
MTGGLVSHVGRVSEPVLDGFGDPPYRTFFPADTNDKGTGKGPASLGAGSPLLLQTADKVGVFGRSQTRLEDREDLG